MSFAAYDLTDADIVRDRWAAVTGVLALVNERITHELKVKHDSTWAFADGPHSDVQFSFIPVSSPASKAVADPKKMSDRAHHIWESALNKWPKVLRGNEFLSLVMQNSTQGLAAETFAEVFQQLTKDGD